MSMYVLLCTSSDRIKSNSKQGGVTPFLVKVRSLFAVIITSGGGVVGAGVGVVFV